MKENSLLTETYREYDFQGRVYRIDNPVTLFTREGGTTHRVLDSEGIVHCLPIPGSHGCVLRWKNKDNIEDQEKNNHIYGNINNIPILVVIAIICLFYIFYKILVNNFYMKELYQYDK
jgi:hypothetical protein